MSRLFERARDVCSLKSSDYSSSMEQAEARTDEFAFGVESYAQFVHTKAMRLVEEVRGLRRLEALREHLVDLVNYASFMDAYLDLLEEDGRGQEGGGGRRGRPQEDRGGAPLLRVG